MVGHQMDSLLAVVALNCCVVLTGQKVPNIVHVIPFHSRFLQYDLSVFNPFWNLPKALQRLDFTVYVNCEYRHIYFKLILPSCGSSKLSKK